MSSLFPKRDFTILSSLLRKLQNIVIRHFFFTLYAFFDALFQSHNFKPNLYSNHYSNFFCSDLLLEVYIPLLVRHSCLDIWSKLTKTELLVIFPLKLLSHFFFHLSFWLLSLTKCIGQTPTWGNPWLLTFSSIHHVLSFRKSYQLYAKFLSVKHVCPCLIGLVLIIVFSQLNYCKTAAAKILNSSFCFASNCYILLTAQYLG